MTGARALATFRRYDPGFFGKAFLVLLRIAIGWHLLSEGLYKVMSTDWGKEHLGRYFHPTEGPVFSSEPYNRAATGPLASNFRSLVPDVEGRDALDFDRLKQAWSEEMNRIGQHYGFDKPQQAQAEAELASRSKVAQAWFDDPENRQKIKKYLDDLDHLASIEAQPRKMSYEVERYNDGRKSIEADRRSLVAPVDSWTKALRDAWKGLATQDQKAQHGEYQPPTTEIQKADLVTMYGLTICGAALMIGLFTPAAAMASSVFLMLFYLSMPPWPGLPVPPNAEGHYVYVNKNLIEFLALLALAATPSGLWLGVDAFLFGWIDRARYRAEVRREAASRPPEAHAQAQAQTQAGPTVTVDIPRRPQTR